VLLPTDVLHANLESILACAAGQLKQPLKGPLKQQPLGALPEQQGPLKQQPLGTLPEQRGTTTTTKSTEREGMLEFMDSGSEAARASSM
jgi:hypothetical protein